MCTTAPIFAVGNLDRTQAALRADGQWFIRNRGGKIRCPITTTKGNVVEIERQLIGSMDIADFADLHGLTMFIGERPRNDAARFYAHFKNTEIKGHGVLISIFGDGSTEKAAISAYAEEISLKRIVINAGHADRRELEVPRLTYKASEEARKPSTRPARTTRPTATARA